MKDKRESVQYCIRRKKEEGSMYIVQRDMNGEEEESVNGTKEWSLCAKGERAIIHLSIDYVPPPTKGDCKKKRIINECHEMGRGEGGEFSVITPPRSLFFWSQPIASRNGIISQRGVKTKDTIPPSYLPSGSSQPRGVEATRMRGGGVEGTVQIGRGYGRGGNLKEMFIKRRLDSLGKPLGA